MFSSNARLLLLEVVVYSLAIVVGILAGKGRCAWLRRPWSTFRKLSHRKVLAVFASIAFVLISRGLLTVVLPTPTPGVNDEFSYLLAGDTFSSGRLTNPSHLMWKSLETFYVIQHPTYASMYPPAQGLALAAGQWLVGSPWIGVYLSVAAMSGAICWMLQGWVPPRWALLGSLVAALRLAIYSYWSESYWGGAVAALGGALVFGALPRICKRQSPSSAVVLGLGILILANSRPYEGMLVTVFAFGSIACYFFKNKIRSFEVIGPLILPVGLVLFAGASAMVYYFWRVTGSPFKMPYALHSSVYEVTGPFFWQPLRKMPEYRYQVMERFHVERQTAAFYRAHHLKSWLLETLHKAKSLLVFYFWPFILPTLAAFPLVWHNSKFRFCLAAAAFMFLGLTLEIWPMTLHYPAPMTAVMVLLMVQVMRSWRVVQWKGYPVGVAVSRAIPIFCAAMLIFRITAQVFHIPVPQQGVVPWFTVSPGNMYRARVAAFLQHQPGPHLAIVRYADNHSLDDEWVHNGADIDDSKVVWARYSDDQQNHLLLSYFSNRHAWLVEVGPTEGRIFPLPTAGKLTQPN